MSSSWSNRLPSGDAFSELHLESQGNHAWQMLGAWKLASSAEDKSLCEGWDDSGQMFWDRFLQGNRRPQQQTAVAVQQIRWVCVAWLRCGTRADPQGPSNPEFQAPLTFSIPLSVNHFGSTCIKPFADLPNAFEIRDAACACLKPFPSINLPMSSDFQHYSFRMPNIGFQNLPLNIYIVVFGTAIFVFILSLLFCCYLIRLRHQAHKELYAYKQVILKEKVKELNLHEICAVCLEEFKPKDELGICPCKHAFHRKCLIKWLEVRKVCPLCNMPVLQLAQLHSKQDPGPPQGPLPGAENIV
ncbi:Rnf24 [Columba livia]|nr:Rnf24 [Columba livia]